MSSPDKRWSWKKVLGEAAGTTAGAAAAAVAAVVLVGTAPLMVPIAGVGAFGGAVLSKWIGHNLDDPWDGSVPSSILYGLAVGGAISSVLFFLALDHLAEPGAGTEWRFFAVGALAGALEGLSSSLMDDFRGKASRHTQHESRY